MLRTLCLTLAALACLAPRVAAAGDVLDPSGMGVFARNIDVPVSAFAEGGIDEGEPRAETRLVFCASDVSPGDEFKAGVLFTLDPGWHVYWRNPGDSGMEPDFIWKSDATSTGEVAWPTPSMFVGGGGVTTYGYSDEVLLSMPIRIVETAEQTATVEVEVDYLVCDVGGCIPHNSTLRRDIPLGPDGAPAGTDAEIAIFDHFSEQQPATVEVEFSRLSPAASEPYDLSAAFVACAGPGGQRADGQRTGAACPGWNEQTGDARFFPDRGSAVRHADVTAWPHPGAYDGIVYRIQAEPARLARTPLRVTGVLVSGDLAFNIDAELPSARSADAALWPVAWGVDPIVAGAPSDTGGAGGSDADPTAASGAGAAANATTTALPLWRVLLFALLGGMLLNLMPCVLPVLALKVAGFASAARDERYHPAAHGAAYGGGVIGTMLALAGVIIALRAAGASVGWGFQFQEPAFVVGVAVVLTVFATNLFGVWDLALNSSRLDEMTRARSGLSRSGFEGVLAVVVATPCSAPLLAPAVGFALAAPAHVIALTFAAIGAGLALPFFLLTTIPAARRLVPRPGGWMVTLKNGLGFALLGTVLWLVWVVEQAFAPGSASSLLLVALVAGFASWVYGVVQRRSHTPAAPAIAAIVMALATVWSASAVLPFGTPSTASGQAPSDAPFVERWEPWSTDAVDAALADGAPVFVDFTADWCISCKVNERLVLNTPEIEAAFEAAGVRAFVGDWTHRDDTIRAELARFGRAGVPVYLYYPAGAAEPVLLPEVLTQDIVLDALAEL